MAKEVRGGTALGRFVMPMRFVVASAVRSFHVVRGVVAGPDN